MFRKLCSTASSTALLQRIIASLHMEFDMTELGALKYFLRISVRRDTKGMFLSQKKYALELLDRAHMGTCHSTRTPVDTESKIGSDEDPVCLHMCDPREPHFVALKRVLRYVRHTLDFGLQLYASSTGSLVAYFDSDWAGCPTTRCFTSEYRGVAKAVAETAWLRNLLLELHTPLLSVTLVYYDNAMNAIEDFLMLEEEMAETDEERANREALRVKKEEIEPDPDEHLDLLCIAIESKGHIQCSNNAKE
ncbi:ribonuclease H-like domain-containing protein [Tanacetum coccineum]